MRYEIAHPWLALAKRAVAEYRAALGDDLVGIALFGSVARNEATSRSDLDLYVVTRVHVSPVSDARLDAPRTAIRRSAEFQALVTAGYLPEPAPIFHTVKQLETHPWILLDIADHGRVLYDPDGVLARELSSVRERLVELGAERLEHADGTWYWDLKPDWRPGDVIEL